jgi:hypothetical protein
VSDDPRHAAVPFVCGAQVLAESNAQGVTNWPIL